MRKFNRKIFFLICICTVLVAGWSVGALAYETYKEGCNSCHYEFGGPGQTLHDLHQPLVNNNCSRCHINPGDTPITGLSFFEDQGCAGCHGRIEDAGNDSLPGGIGAGLRQHHTNSGAASCTGCHTDSDPANYTPVGEDVFPPFYPELELNPYSDHLDNNGDLLYDGANPGVVSAAGSDVDSDGVAYDEDNCPGTPNPGQQDVDNDGIGDACDEDTIYGYISGEFKEDINVNIGISSCSSPTIIATLITDEEGYYAIGNLEDNRYLVYPEDSEYVFVPNFAIVNIHIQ
jgi:hypothetical protein